MIMKTKTMSINSMIPKTKPHVNTSQTMRNWEKEVGERSSSPKEKKSWKIHPSEAQWRENMKGLNPIQRCILIDLRFYTRTKVECYPSVALLGKNLNVAPSTISRNLSGLVRKHLIKVVRQTGEKNHYKPLINF